MSKYLDGKPYTNDPDADNIEEVYKLCHKWVFDCKAAGGVGQYRALILTRAADSRASLKLFILANMLGWKQTHFDQPFHSKMLTSDFAVHQVKTFASSCSKLYGSFTCHSLDQIMGTDIESKDIETQILNSEIKAGAWIVDYKLFANGNVSQTMYERIETHLHPYWLAIEPTYYREVMYDHTLCPDPNLGEDVARHRLNVSHLLGKLKTHPSLALTVFRMREKIMPEAIQNVLSLKGLSSNEFQIDPTVYVTSPVKFWLSLALAIQQIECIKHVNGAVSIYAPK